MAEIKVQVPLAQDVAAAVDALRKEIAQYDGARVVLSGLEGNATLTVRVPSPHGNAEELEHELRLAPTSGCVRKVCSGEPSSPAPRPARPRPPPAEQASRDAAPQAEARADRHRPDRARRRRAPRRRRGSAAVMCANVDLDQLRPVEIGENSFVYAVDNSLLGSIPAEAEPAADAGVEDQQVDAGGDGHDRGPALHHYRVASTSRASRAPPSRT